MGKYADHCVTPFLKQNNPPEPGRSDVLMFGQEYFAQAPYWVEHWTVTGNCAFLPGTPREGEMVFHLGKDGHKGGPYPKYHRNVDNLMFFYGTDPKNIHDLGARVEFHLGEGEQEEVFEFDQPRCIYIPKGTRHMPFYVTGFRRNFVVFDVLLAPTRKDAGTDNDFSYRHDEVKMRQFL